MQFKHACQAIRTWGKPFVSVVLTAAITCTSAPISAFAPVMAYAQPLNPLTQNIERGGGVASELGGTSVQTAGEQSGVTYTADGRPLYESASDTIYIYNALQTAVARQEDAADQPVLTGDGDAETFGTGQPIYAEGSDEPLTYSPEHTYVYVDGWDEGLEDAGENNVELQTGKGEGDDSETPEEPDAEKNVEAEKGEQVEKNDEAEKNDDSATDSTTTGESGSSDTDESTAAQDAATIAGAEVLSDGEDGTTGKVLLADERAVGELDGRDYVGQTVKNINGTDYILIGNEQQLRAIGSNKHVTDKVWYRLNSWDEWELKYGGDADLASGEELADDEYVNNYYGGVLDRGWAGTNEDGTPAKHNPDTGLTYSSSANYIIFRDIELSSGWTPLMFTGTMFGSKSATGTTAGSLWDYFETEGANSGISDISIMDGADSRPKISNVDINQDSPISTDKQSGVGFFASLYSESEVSESSLGKSKGKVRVNGIILDGVRVTTSTTETVDTDTLVSIVADILGGLLGLVGGVLEILLGWLPGFKDLSLGDALRNLFNLHNSDPSVFATGAFAGRIVGDVEVEHCTVSDVLVSNANSMTGGFVGYIEGQPQYSILDDISGELINTLTQILNAIPGLGLGDLITLLLDNNILDLNSLIPIGYYRPVISDCDVDTFVAAAEGETPTIGLATTSFAGGFAGVQIGAIIESSRVESEGALQINAKEYAGGFVGLMRDGEVQGLLENLGVKLVDLTRPQSLAYESTVHVAMLSVAAADKHAGGFTGATAASHLVNSSVQAKTSLNVKAPLYAGGLVGEATMGWITNLGADEGDENLLKSLAGIVTRLVGQDNSGQLLALMGFDPSTILGGSVIGGSVTVASTGDYAGGMVGKGEGVTIASSTADQVQKLAFWQTGERYAGTTPATRGNLVLGLSQVQSGGSYAGGIAGAMETASVGGLLNGVLDIGSLKNLAGGGFTAFEVSDARVNDASAMQELVDGKALWIDSTIVPNAACTVAAEGYSAGGAIGCATGGAVDNVSVHGLSSVKAVGEVGGFIGQAAAGDVLGSDGVNLLGLVRLSGLLSVATSSRLTVNDSSVEGAAEGFTVQATGEGSASTDTITAGGFYGRASSMLTTDCHVRNLASVAAPTSNGAAGGFVGLSTTGGLASAASDTDEGSGLLKDILGHDGLLSITDLLGAVPYMVPTYKVSDVSFCEAGGSVSADVAGGFAGNFESGKVNVFDDKDSQELVQAAADAPWTVYNLASVTGCTYAGGYAGRMISGSLAEAGGGLSLLGDSLKLNLTELLNVVSAYVPTVQRAGVRSADATKGLVVSSSKLDDTDAYSGSAGGFVGYACGAQISECDVDCLRNTVVTEPADLETANADEAQVYFGGQSSYAVTAARYAGGYVGYLNIGSAAGVGSGLKVLKLVELSNLTSALNVVASTIEHSDVQGAAGGFAVLANGREAATGVTGYAGGFAGKISGGQIQDANCYNFSYVIGQTAAGGYAGEIEPGSVADVLGSASQGDDGILSGLLGADNLATLVQSFVPVIRNSETTCIPCGGAVRAQALTTEEGGVDGSDTKVTVQRGMAGGYVGHSVGGQIWGNSSSSWKDEVDEGGNYTGVRRESAAIRIRSVYGAEYAGGFTGLMESGDTASAGGLNLLFGLVTVGNLLSALSVVYPTEENTAVYGPLRGLSAEEWNSWVDYVGIHGGYGSSLAGSAGKVDPDATDEELAAKLSEYVYGTHVVAGRQTYESVAAGGGAAGGYVGSMVTGTITNGKAYDTKLVRAMRAAGGFAGAAEAGAAATLGSVGLLNGVLEINLNELLSAAQIFVPAIKNSSVEGYRLGVTVESPGSGSQPDDVKNATGNAGGYIGYGAGAQIWGDGSTASEGESDAGAAHGCNVSGLRRVRAAAYAGGFAGKLTAGAAAKLNTDIASDGFLQQVLDALVGSTDLNDLVSVLKLSMSVVRGTTVTGFDEAWGYTVESYRDGSYPIAAGGYAGAVEATVLGKLNQDENALTANHVERLRGVDGGYYAGGFVGLADVGGVADVVDGGTEGSNVTILGLLGIGDTSVLQVFQPCVYGATVSGVSDGITVRTHDADDGGLLDSNRSSGNAGGFAGSVMSGTVQDARVEGLNAVSGPGYIGGFIGYTGKSGVLDVENISALDSLLGVTAGALNVFSTIVKRSSVTGISAGYTVSATDSEGAGDGKEQVAGGFIGYADLAHVDGCKASGLKRVGSDGTAGGFAGKTTFAYLLSAQADSVLVRALTTIVNELVKLLYLDEAERLDVIVVDLGEVLKLDVLADGDVLSVTLLGLDISVSLSKDSDTDPETTDVAIIKIGDSVIKLPCNEKGLISTGDDDTPELELNLIKANRAEITRSTVTGIADGYDVFGGGASQDGEAPHAGSGYAGGFVGHNDEGKLQGNEMVLADVVKGAANKTGAFTGVTSYSSNWWFNDVADVETGNTYHVYRDASLVGAGVENISADLTVENAVSDNAWARFDVTKHVPNANESNLADWQNATVAKEGAEAQALGVMASASKAVLMADAEVTDNTGGLTPEPEDGQDPCEASIDLTLRKIWEDGIFGLVRPSEVEFVLYATYTDDDGVLRTLYYDQDCGALVDEKSLQVDSEGKPIKPTVTVTKEDAESLWSSTWREVIESLPVATEEGHYYTYYVDEVDVAGYETSQVTADHEEQVFTVTNKFTGMPLLPGTGGIGTTLIVATGLATLILGGVWLDQQRRRRNPPRAYAGAHFANAASNTRRASK